jgi:CheY-like chemotaxis protein
MNIQLPGINSVEALQRLRADPLTSRTPVIAVTASVMNSRPNANHGRRVRRLQGKPISIKHLLTTVGEIPDKP